MSPKIEAGKELDEILFMAFVGLYTRDVDGNFISLDDKHGVLKDHLKAELLAWRDKAVMAARVQELQLCNRLGGRLDASAVIYRRIDQLTNGAKDA